MDSIGFVLASIGLVVVVLGLIVFIVTVMDTNSKVCQILNLLEAEEDEEMDEDGKEPE